MMLRKSKRLQDPCETCPANAQLAQMGLKVEAFDRVVALAGNPNTGKSTVFNTLTGLNQHTGNWPGKTVTRAEGGYVFNDVRYKLVDLPGTYSLLSASQDEEVARNFLLFGQPDCTIVVTDATALERNLNLALQVMEITDKVVVAINLMDEARRKGLEVDARSLARDLGVPAIPITARTGEGIQTLLMTVDSVIKGQVHTQPRPVRGTDAFQRAVEELVPHILQLAPNIPNPRWLAIRLLDGDARVQQALMNGELIELAGAQGRADMQFSKKIALGGRQ
ncbi:MAG TPA: FeoB small GTPase domain-containing protein [Anaerolineales bacterium]|nr:FeoB small GTPase domain-containing protein [Anaerolineales bacterium]